MSNNHCCPNCSVPLNIETCGVYFTFTPVLGKKSVSADLEDEEKKKMQLLIDGANSFKEKLDKHMERFNLNEKERNGLFYINNDVQDKNSKRKEIIDHSTDKDLKWNKVTINRNPENFEAEITCDIEEPFNEDSYPACHHCGYILPKNFFAYKQVFNIALVGAAGSCISVYLQSLTRNQCGSFSDFRGLYEFDYQKLNTLGAQQFYIDNANKLDTFGILPPKTIPGFYLPLLLDMEEINGKEKYLISITDIAGESFMESTNNEGYEAHREFLRNCDGCLLLVSLDEILYDKNLLSIDEKHYTIPENKDKSIIDNRYVGIITKITERLIRNKKRPFVSFVLTKCDLLKDREVNEYEKIYNEDKTLEKWSSISDAINCYCIEPSNFIPKQRRQKFNRIPIEYFAVSATGRTPDSVEYSELDKACTDDKKRKEKVWHVKGGIKPKYVELPFIWLIEKLLENMKNENENI
ncbi:MAG: hypothetical protein LBM93_01805 [Oscillospiraceae bacterium]|jgi:hypothetical protein|nr:hypothetical protein [Oscillospiraceae bacterium]